MRVYGFRISLPLGIYHDRNHTLRLKVGLGIDYLCDAGTRRKRFRYVSLLIALSIVCSCLLKLPVAMYTTRRLRHTRLLRFRYVLLLIAAHPPLEAYPPLDLSL